MKRFSRTSRNFQQFGIATLAVTAGITPMVGLGAQEAHAAIPEPTMSTATIGGYQTATVKSPVITSDMVKGGRITLRMNPDDNTRYDSKNTPIVARKSDGTVKQVLPDIGAGGGWEGGGNMVVPLTQDLVGTSIEYTALYYTTTGVPAGTKSTITGSVETSVGNSSTSITVSTVADKGKPTGKTLWAPFDGSKDRVGDKYQVPTIVTSSGKVFKGDAQRGQDVWLDNELVAHPDSAPEKNVSTSLAKVPKMTWNGGNTYWSKFPSTVKAGWDKDSFFPIMLWWGQLGSDEDAKWMKSLGINTMIGDTNKDVNTTTIMKNNNIHWMGRILPGMSRSDTIFVGDWYDDETDLGTGTWTEAKAKMDAVSFPDHSKPRYTNYTSYVVRDNYQDYRNHASNKYLVNNYTDQVSIDNYLLSGPFCDSTATDIDGQWLGAGLAVPLNKANCRTGQGYGTLVDNLRVIDALDGKIQSTPSFVENSAGGDDWSTFYRPVTPEQTSAAAFSSLVHNATGIAWFNNSFQGPCANGNVIGAAQHQGTSYPCYGNVQAMKKINLMTQELAPALNSQSYVWYTNPTLRTRTNLVGNTGYIFAIPKTADNGGTKKMVIPDEFKNKKITVWGENRTITPNTDGTFTDTFKDKNDHHVYIFGNVTSVPTTPDPKPTPEPEPTNPGTTPTKPTNPTNPGTPTPATIKGTWTQEGNVHITMKKVLQTSDIGQLALGINTATEKLAVQCGDNNWSLFIDGKAGKVNWNDAGCWAGGAQYPFTVTPDMVGKTVIQAYKAKPVGTTNTATITGYQLFNGTKKTLSPITVTKPTTTTTPPPATSFPKTVAIQHKSPVLTTADIGKNVVVEISGISEEGALQCDTAQLRVNGSGTDVRNWTVSGCYAGKVSLSGTVTPAMIGSSLVLDINDKLVKSTTVNKSYIMGDAAPVNTTQKLS